MGINFIFVAHKNQLWLVSSGDNKKELKATKKSVGVAVFWRDRSMVVGNSISCNFYGPRSISFPFVFVIVVTFL